MRHAPGNATTGNADVRLWSLMVGHGWSWSVVVGHGRRWWVPTTANMQPHTRRVAIGPLGKAVNLGNDLRHCFVGVATMEWFCVWKMTAERYGG